MGYTHYWGNGKGVTQDAYDMALNHCRNIINKNLKILASGDGEKGTKPELTTEICFNGIEDDSHETFYLPIKVTEVKNFDFCKTQHKEYDKVVVACLITLHNFCPQMEISSDGNEFDHKEGLELARKVTGLPLVGMTEEVPCNAAKFIEKLDEPKKKIPKKLAAKKALAKKAPKKREVCITQETYNFLECLSQTLINRGDPIFLTMLNEEIQRVEENGVNSLVYMKSLKKALRNYKSFLKNN